MTETTQERRRERRRGRPRKDEAGNTKEALLEASLTLFAQHGYAGTSIRAIAREVGLSESVLYAHFANKQAIFDTAIRRMGPEMTGEILARASQPHAETDPPEFVRAVIAQALEMWDTPRSRQWTSLLSRDGIFNSPAVRNGVENAIAMTGKIFERWIADGRVRDGFDKPEHLAYELFSPITMVRLLYLHSEATPEMRETARQLATRHAEHFILAVLR